MLARTLGARTLVLAGVALLSASGPALSFPVSQNMTLHKLIDDHPGASDVWGYTAPNGTELAIYGHAVGTSFVDATDPPNATEIWNLPGPQSTWRDIKTYLNYAYIVTEGGGTGTGLQIVDLTNPLSPVHVGTYTDFGYTTAHNIWIDTEAAVAYCCGASPGGGMYILSLADPENPVELDYFTQFYIHDLYVQGGRGYCAAISSGSLRIIDVTNPSSPFTLASHFYPGAATHTAWPNDARTHCVTTDETGGGHLKIWNVQNLSNIFLSSEWEAPTETAIVHNAHLKNDMAYVSYYKAGTWLVDLTDPANPVPVGYYDTSTRNGGFDGNWGVYPFRDDDVIYSSDRQEGLYILEFTGGFAGEITGTIRDGQTLGPLDNATVKVHETLSLPTDGSGFYSGFASGGAYDVVTTRFGYAPDTSNVVIPEDGVLVHDVNMQAIPSGTVQIRIVAPGGAPIPGMILSVLDSPIEGLVTDGAGEVTINGLPVGLPWTVRVGRFGWELTDVIVTSSVGTTEEYEFTVQPGFFDDFEADQAWIVGAADDDATGGIWERAIPVASLYIGPIGPGEDASPTGAGYAFVTENHVEGTFAGSSDVDNGKTTLLSPVFDGTGFAELDLNYSRWFSNRAPSQSDDEFRCDVSTDAGATWTNLETVDFGTDSWANVLVSIDDVVTPTATMQIRFVAEDLETNTYVEAGVDDVSILTSATSVGRPGFSAGVLSFSAPTPNPFRDQATLAFQIPSAGPVSLEIYDVTGRRVARLMSGERVAAGSHRVIWQGRNDAGQTVAPGVYFANLVTVDGAQTRKLTMLR